jgi:hypothetical protein
MILIAEVVEAVAALTLMDTKSEITILPNIQQDLKNLLLRIIATTIRLRHNAVHQLRFHGNLKHSICQPHHQEVAVPNTVLGSVLLCDLLITPPVCWAIS